MDSPNHRRFFKESLISFFKQHFAMHGHEGSMVWTPCPRLIRDIHIYVYTLVFPRLRHALAINPPLSPNIMASLVNLPSVGTLFYIMCADAEVRC